jgi:RNA polymerase sigma factor (sigma-70 family)
MFGSRLHSQADQDRFLLKIHSTAREVARKIVEHDEPDDVAQDVAIACLVKLRSGEWTHEPANFEGFVLKLVRDCAIDRMRTRISAAENDAEHLRDRTGRTPEWMPADQSKNEESMEWLRRTLVAKVPVHCRSAYRLVREEGLSYAEVATVLGISIKTVQSHIVQAQRVLRDELRAAGIPVAYSARGGRPRGGRWRHTKIRLQPRYLPPSPEARTRHEAWLPQDVYPWMDDAAGM